MASGSKTATTGTQLQCEGCGNIHPIQRNKGRQKKKNHLKHMYCFKCKETTGHYEVKEDIFIPEWIRD